MVVEDKLPHKAPGDSKVVLVAEGKPVADKVMVDMFAALGEDKVTGDMEQQSERVGKRLQLDKEKQHKPRLEEDKKGLLTQVGMRQLDKEKQHKSQLEEDKKGLLTLILEGHSAEVEHSVVLHPCALEQMVHSSTRTFEVYGNFGSA